ncbi:MAG: carboxypeptidase-like regulatory domain-containing protein [Eudoraea sp.]|nr:carboxypeptidase-like regulatory domain-containing protein [Eudoraea sp.]
MKTEKIASYFFFLLVILPCIKVFSQQAARPELLARVLDSKTRIPIVFATVSLKNNGNGVVTDRDGYFRLPYKYTIGDEQLSISSIGYATKTIAVAVLKSNTINTIFLTPKTEELQGVVLSANSTATEKAYLKPEEIVRKAIQRIPLNCPSNPYSYIAYYRDYQLYQDDYINLNEALVEVYDAGYNSDKLEDTYNQTSLMEYKENSEFPRDTIWSSNYDNSGQKFIKDARIAALGGNELSILNLHDPIRNRSRNSFSFVNTFKSDFLENHRFKLVGITYRDEVPIYQISFKTKYEKIKSRYAAEGTIYIAKESFGIYKLSYKGYERHAYDPLYSLELEYLPKGGKMTLNYISFNNNFQVRSRENFRISSILLDQEKNAFFITFNNPVKTNTVSNLRNYRFIYKKRKLNMSAAQIVAPRMIKITLVNGALPELGSIDEKIMSNVSYKIKNIEDTTGRKLGKLSLTTINQFREMFVQKVFIGKALPLNGRFIDKNRALSDMEKVNHRANADYWINTPLKLTK